jgi:acyl transferase domain-containing protein/NADPH:quinone reductase-like Zn-dependent oxidoreductase
MPGGYLDDIDRFDAGFFGISPREARALDPQQRLALELSWEALEDAGIVAERLRGSRTAVYIGMMADDYAALSRGAGTAAIDHHTSTGLQRSLVANRVSYFLGLRGPSMVVDTGQSASLVAVHMACESLWRGEVTAALVGGVQLNLSPESATAVERFGALSPDGRSYTFDARANGYVRGEGGGFVVLKTLSQARADGDDVYAVVRGSAVNNDGGGEGLAVPSAGAQEAVLREAYGRAGVNPVDVQYVELHGTGTAVGDRTEAESLGSVVGAPRPATSPALRIGSAKTNVGHLEGAAGIVGLIKVVLALRHEELPPSLNYERGNPRIRFQEWRLEVQRNREPWPARPGELLAGVSSFGMGGTNCHVVLASAPATGEPASDVPEHRANSVLPLALSATTPGALRAQADGLVAWLNEHPELGMPDVAFSLSVSRTAFDHRAVVTGAERQALLSGLGAVARGRSAAGLVSGQVQDGALAFLFSGQGSQRAGMGRHFDAVFPVFADALDAVLAHLDAELGRSLRGIMFAEAGSPAAALLDETRYTQPALFAVEIALYRLLESWGVSPDYVAGHSVGEIAAAHVAGVLSLPDACRLVAARGRLMQDLTPRGVMTAVAATEAEVRELLSGHEHEASVAAVNGAMAVVIAGHDSTVAAIAAQLTARGRRTKSLRGSHAFHSPLMDPMLPDFARVLEGLTFNEPSVPLVSMVTGELIGDDVRDPRYWVRHAREAVRFDEGVRALLAEGVTTLLEVGPDGVLTGMVRDGLDSESTAAAVPVSLRGRDEEQTMVNALASLHVRGRGPDWPSFFAGTGGRRVALPTYAFQRESYWLDHAEASVADPDSGGRQAGTPARHSAPERSAPAGEPPAGESPAGGSPAGGSPAGGSPARLRAVGEAVLDEIAAVGGFREASAVEVGTPFREQGFDSLMLSELRDRVTTATGLRLPVSAFFSYPTATALIGHVCAELDGSPGTVSEGPPPAPPVADDDPVVIVGMSCHYPNGIDSAEDLWRVVSEGADMISTLPADRGWDLIALDAVGAREGGFLRNADEFDAGFFSISPREALAMDPQQRLTLESAWEAFESAGIAPADLRGTRTGVFVGASPQEYGPRMAEAADGAEGFVLTGNSPSVIAGRVAYVLGLEGPAVTVDTACSSSLVALHLASQSLRSGESDLVLAGGVTVMATPGMFVEFSHQSGLAQDGRCKAFAEAADGTAWSEGIGMVVLERLSDARRHGHRVSAVVAASAVNQDGASNGLSAPNGLSQQRVIRQAVRSAGLSSSDVDVVEAHGTGTRLGDPVEAQALLATYGQHRDRPLWLGSVKSNIGHTQAASGVAGLIKMVMAMRYEVLPRTLHVDHPSSQVDWDSGAVSLLTAPVPWPHADRIRRAAVSSFGISGTNAHVILAQPPAVDAAPADRPPAPSRTPWVLSGKTPDAVRGQAARLLTHLESRPGLSAPDVGLSLAATRSVFTHRAVVIGADRGELVSGLRSLVSGDSGAGLVQGAAGPDRRVAFLFPGQGSQWVGMGKSLLRSSPVFRESMARCSTALSEFVDWSLLDVLDDEAALSRVDVVQPVLWAVMVSLSELWRSTGVQPEVVVGHSQGEIAAACVAGLLSLSDGARVVAVRSRAIAEVLAGHGAMLSVFLPAAEVRSRLSAEAAPAGVSLAAVNGPRTTVVSGSPDALRQWAAELAEADVHARMIDVNYASHSVQVEPLRERLQTDLAQVKALDPLPGGVAFLSTVSSSGGTAVPDAGYWFQNLRETVELDRAITALRDRGITTVIEVSPHPVLLPALDTSTVGIGTLRRGDGDLDRFLASLSEAFTHGVPVDWPALFASTGARPVELPTYAFQRRRFWPAASRAGTPDATSIGLATADHPLLGAGVELPGSGGHLFTGRFGPSTHPWLADHAVNGVAVLPGTAFLEMVLRAGAAVGCGHVEELTLHAPLVLDDEGAVQLQIVLGATVEAGGRGVEVHARQSGDTEWTLHAVGSLTSSVPVTPKEEWAREWPPGEAQQVDVTDFYERAADLGYDYGPAFQGLGRVWRGSDTVFAEVTLAEEQWPAADSFGVHPALLDLGVQTLRLAGEELDRLLLPFSWGGVSMTAAGARSLRVRVVRTGQDTVSIAYADTDGASVLTVDSLVSRPPAGDVLPAPVRDDGELLLVEWFPVPHGIQPVATVPLERAGLDLDALQARLAGDGVPPRFAVLPVGAGNGADVPGDVRETCAWMTEVLQDWLARPALEDVRLVIATRKAVADGDGGSAVDLAGAAVWGLIRSAQTEHPGRFVLVDHDAAELDPAVLDGPVAAGEDQLTVRAGQVGAARLVPVPDDSGLPVPGNGLPWRLAIEGKGTLENLVLATAPELAAPLAPGAVRVAVRAAGLNFRDIVNALGMIPGQDSLMGAEAAGIVLDVGPGVQGVRVGDRVLGLFLHSGVGPLMVTDQRLLVPLPQEWSFAEAGTAPVVFLTAHHGLVKLAGLRPGESVLIHAGSGGVGMAAIQLALQLGAEVFATASEAKWDTLRAWGVRDDHIASSRTVDFEQHITDVTNGRGVDVVLNSLTREFVDASLRLLRPGGRFIELGKTDIRDATDVAESYPGVSYEAFDLLVLDPEMIEHTFADLTALFRSGALKPLPVTTWDVRHAPEAFRYVSQAKHIGKVALTLPRPLDPAGTVLITGGTGGLGAALARHLVTAHGVRHLVLTSRRGPDAENAPRLTAELAALDAEVRVVAADVSDRAAVAEVLAAVAPGHPLTAVVHTAGVLADATIGSLTRSGLDQALAPKVDGAWHLHELTRDLDLSAFIVYSSIAATLGNPGQANYAAANAFLDALTRYRRGRGLSAVSLAWGMWSQEAGMTTALSRADMLRMERSGVPAMPLEQGLRLFDRAMKEGHCVVAPTRLNRAALRRQDLVAPILRVIAHKPSRFAPAAVAVATGEQENGLAQRLAALTVTERNSALLDVVRREAATVLGHAGAEDITPTLPFKGLGFDSLTSMELRNRLSAATGLRLGVTVVFDYPTPAALVEHLLAELPADDDGVPADVFADLEKLESSFGLMDRDEAVTSRVRDRLRTLLARIEGDVEISTAAGTLDSATTDELFAFLDEHLE